MGPSKHPVESGDQRQGSSPSPQPTQGTFPNLLQKGGSLVSMGKGQPGSQQSGQVST